MNAKEMELYADLLQSNQKNAKKSLDLQFSRKKAWCISITSTVFSMLGIFFPLWFMLTSFKVAYGIELCSPTQCNCDVNRHCENNTCLYNCPDTCRKCSDFLEISNRFECTCTMNKTAHCIQSCNTTNIYGTSYAYPNPRSVYCMVIQDLYLYEETQCWKLFGNEMSDKCKPGFDCHWQESSDNLCTSYCAWGQAITRRTWNWKALAGKFDYVTNVAGDIVSDYPHSYHLSMNYGSCMGGFINLDGKVVCVDNLGSLPDWVMCNSHTPYDKNDIIAYVKQLLPSHNGCDREHHFIRSEMDVRPFALSCSFDVTYTDVPNCEQTEYSPCVKGAYINKEGFAMIQFPSYCSYQGKVVNEITLQDCEGCSLDCTWSLSKGSGFNKSCSNIWTANMTRISYSIHDSPHHTTARWVGRVFCTCCSLLNVLCLVFSGAIMWLLVYWNRKTKIYFKPRAPKVAWDDEYEVQDNFIDNANVTANFVDTSRKEPIKREVRRRSVSNIDPNEELYNSVYKGSF